jgi:CRP-like cAMP-binding protein
LSLPHGVSLLFGAAAGTLLETAAPICLADKDVLVRQGDSGDCMFVVLEGELDVIVDLGFGPVHAACIGAGELIGEVAVFARQPRNATIVARGGVRLLRVEGSSMLAALERSPETARAILAELGRRLMHANRPLAFFSVAARELQREDFSPAMLRSMAARADELGPFARTFSGMISEIESKHLRQQEMEMARQIQRSVLPRPLPQNSSLPVDLYAFMRPMREIGGDFYDYFQLGPGRLAFAVGDVSGKGVPASLFMMMCRTVLRSVAGTGLSVDDCLARLNAVLVENNELCMFVTLFFGVLDLESGTLHYCNAGHNPPFLLRAGGAVESLDPTGPAAAVLETAAYAAGRTRLASGDRLFAFSDGVTDALSPERDFFGVARLLPLLQEYRARPAVEMIDAVVAAVDAFADTAEQFDDITCLALSLR